MNMTTVAAEKGLVGKLDVLDGLLHGVVNVGCGHLSDVTLNALGKVGGSADVSPARDGHGVASLASERGVHLVQTGHLQRLGELCADHIGHYLGVDDVGEKSAGFSRHDANLSTCRTVYGLNYTTLLVRYSS